MVAITGALFCLLFILNEARLAALYTSVYNAAIKVDDEIQNKTLWKVQLVEPNVL